MRRARRRLPAVPLLRPSVGGPIIPAGVHRRAGASGGRAASTASPAAAAAAAAAADTLVRAWSSALWIASPADYPPPPRSVDELYAVHDAIAAHPLAQTPPLNGVAGWKVGAVGAEGEVCIVAPLFRGFIVDAPGAALSAAAIQMHQIEPELAVVMAEDLPPRLDGEPHTAEGLLLPQQPGGGGGGGGGGAIRSVSLCIECCGQRGTSEVMAAQSPLGRFQDALAAGGIVLGPELQLQPPPLPQGGDPGVDAAALQSQLGELSACETALLVNGQVVAEGSTSRCPAGGPIEAVAWLANHLNSRGMALEKGQVIATGQTCMTKEFAVGDVVEGRFGAFGSVEMVVAP